MIHSLNNKKEEFPVNPDEGKWAEVPTKDTYWLILPEDCQGELENIKKFVAENKGKYTDIVTIGMGGSSRPTDVVSMFKEALQASGAKVHVNEVFGVGPVYEHSYRQYFMQGPNSGFFTFVVSKDPGGIIIPDDIPGFTFAMQNALQAYGTMEALVNDDYTYKITPRLAVRIEIDGKFTPEVMGELEKFFTEAGGSG